MYKPTRRPESIEDYRIAEISARHNLIYAYKMIVKWRRENAPGWMIVYWQQCIPTYRAYIECWHYLRIGFRHPNIP